MAFLTQYTYLLGVLILSIIWCVIFFAKRINRNEMLFAGVVFGIAGIIISTQYALHDYWHPTYLLSGIPIEDFLYGFLFGGICTQIYFLFFEIKKRTTKNHHYVFAFVSFFIAMLSFAILTGILKLNSIVAHIAPPLLI